MRALQFLFGWVVTLCVFSLTSLVILGIWSWTDPAFPAEEEPQKCTVEQGVKAATYLQEHKGDPSVTLDKIEAKSFLDALKTVTQGRLDLTGLTHFKLVFIRITEPENGWLLFGYGEPQEGKDCVFGKIGLPNSLVARAIAEMQGI